MDKSVKMDFDKTDWSVFKNRITVLKKRQILAVIPTKKLINNNRYIIYL